MEVGALVCKPKNPNCNECPINVKCLAFAKGNMTDFPVKEKKLKVRNRYLNYLVVIVNESLSNWSKWFCG